jgi:putative transcription factor
MECEICGSAEAEHIILVEGAKLHACRGCSDTGKILKSIYPPHPQQEAAPSRRREELEIVDGYGKLIADARKRMGLPLVVLAERISEKGSFIERIEHERTLPGEKLARKLEKELGIKLLQGATSGVPVNVKDGKGGGITLGDILEIEKRKKQ